MMRPSLRIKHGRKLLIEVEGAVEGVQEGGAEGVGDLGEEEVEVEEGARIYGAIKVGIEPENEPGRRPSRCGIIPETKNG